jgi:translation initiation factor 1
MKTNRRNRTGIVYSTDPEFEYKHESVNVNVTLPVHKQNLKIMLDSKNRQGKKVTLISGFVGNDYDIEQLTRELKTICGAGGSAKNGEIIIQGDFRDKLLKYLSQKGYKTKKSGG